tara:strand:- start:1968 stop:3008 length:1041 start_codon:yes stop_codon:yes gene_type:complete
MANLVNTGFKIHPTASQYFIEGPNSGSVVDLNFDVSLFPSQSSFVTLNGRNYFYKVFDPETCTFTENNPPGRIINATTQSLRGIYDIQYNTGSSEGILTPAISGTIQVLGLQNFNQSVNFEQIEQFQFPALVNSSGTGSYQISGSKVISNKVFFRYINQYDVDFFSEPSPNYVLTVARPFAEIPTTANTIQVNFILDEATTIEEIQNNVGQGFTGVTSALVSFNSDTQNLEQDSFIVQAGGNTRTYLINAGENVDFTLQWNGNQSMNINYVFDDAASGVSLNPQGTDMLGNATITSTVFNSTFNNFSQGVVYQNPLQLSIGASTNLDKDYKLTIRLGHSQNLQANQ